MGLPDVVKQVSGDKGKILRLEVYIYVLLAMGSFLVVFGSSRRRYKNAFLRLVIMVVFNSSFIFITYIIGQMVSIPTDNSFFFAIWAWYLLLFHGISDTISAHSLEDNEQWRRSFLTLHITTGWLVAVILVTSLQTLVLRVPLWTQVIVSSIFKGLERIEALKKGSKNGVARESKLVADFMGSDQHESPAGSAHHNYVIVMEQSRIDIASEKVITVGKVWNCDGQLLSATGDPGSKMKDVCLSFSMYNLLCCHFAGFSFPQAARDRQWEFVRHVLLDGDIGAGENYQRTFRLIEQELGFLYDHLYTKYAILFKKNRHVWKFFFWVYAAGISVLVQLLVLIPKEHSGVENFIRVTRIIIGVFMCLELLQILLFIISNWGKLLLLCKYVQKPSWKSNCLCNKFVREVCSFPCFKPWGRQLGQYSFIKSFDKNPPWYDNNLLSKVLSTGASKGHAGNTFVPLSPEVQRAVLGWIKQNGRRLTKGRASLIDNGVTNQELLSACEFEKTSQLILVWHIATDLCQFQHRSTPSLGKFVVPVELSKYCAYLVAFAPRLLPDHYVYTDGLFDSTVIDAEELLEGCKSMEDKYSKIINFAETTQSLPENVTGAGGWVARLLMEEVGGDVERLWKILADFWTEMVLFVAPSDDPWPHAEHLAQGGEFATQLLALLFHAGVSKRDFIPDAAMV